MSDKAEAIAELEQKYVGFREQFADLPEAAYRETWLGSWSLNQLLAHMAGWWREMAGAFARVAHGERPTPEGVDYSDPQPWNDRFAAQAKDGRAALDDWDDAFHEYYAAAKALDESYYGIDAEKGRPKIGNRLLQGAGTEHFDEHRADLESWVGARP